MSFTILDGGGNSITIDSETGGGTTHREVMVPAYAAVGAVPTRVAIATPLPVLSYAGGAYFDESGVARAVTRTVFSVVTGTSNGTIVGAQGVGVRVRVLAVVLQVGTIATNITFWSAATVAISHTFQNDIYGGAVLGDNPRAWFQTNANEALTATTTGGGSNVNGEVVWVQAA